MELQRIKTIVDSGMIYLPGPKVSVDKTRVFVGWYTTPDFKEGTLVQYEYYNQNEVTNLYGKWMNVDEYFNGSSMERPFICEDKTVNLKQTANNPTYYIINNNVYAGYKVEFVFGEKAVSADCVIVNGYDNEILNITNADGSKTELVILEKGYYIIKVTTNVDINVNDNCKIVISENVKN